MVDFRRCVSPVFKKWYLTDTDLLSLVLPTLLHFHRHVTESLSGTTEVSNMPAMFSALISYAFIAHLSLGWRTCYYWCFAFEFMSAVFLFFFYKPPTFETKHLEDHKTKLQLLKELDYVGLVMFTAATTLLLIGINWVWSQSRSLIAWLMQESREELAIRGKVPTSLLQLFLLQPSSWLLDFGKSMHP